MKSISTLIKATIFTGVITLLIIISPTQLVQATTIENHNATITSVTDSTVTIQSDNNKTYLMENEEGSDGWQVNDKATITLKDNEIIQMRSAINFRELYNLGTDGTTYTNSLQTDAELTQYAQQFLKDNYNDTLNIPIVFNKVYNSSDSNMKINGLTTFTIDNKPIQIIIDSDLSGNLNQIKAEKVLIHELVHYEMAKQGNEYNDGTNTFETEVIAKGSISNYGQEGILHSHVSINQNLYN